jgi:hypothetical protein
MHDTPQDIEGETIKKEKFKRREILRQLIEKLTWEVFAG